jgi:hypothetical protein
MYSPYYVKGSKTREYEKLFLIAEISYIIIFHCRNDLFLENKIIIWHLRGQQPKA